MGNYKKFTDEKCRGVVLDSSTRELVLKTLYLMDKNCSSDVFDSTLELIKILIESKRARHYSRYMDQISDVLVGNLHIIISSSTVVINNYIHKVYFIPSSLEKTRSMFNNFLHEFKK
jgi:hypothetical protein